MTTATKKIPSGYKQTEIGVIPADWDVKNLGEIADIKRGKFTPRPRNDPKYYGGNIPFVQTGDVTNSNGKALVYSQTLNEEGLAVSVLFKKGTILMTIAANIGYTAILQIDMACPDSLVAINGLKGFNNNFLNYYFIYKRKEIENVATSGAQKNLNIELLRPFQLCVPSTIAEQIAIATALSDVDILIQKQKQLIEKKKDVKHGVMQELLTGKRRLSKFSGKWEAKTIEDLEKTGDIILSRGKVISKKDIENFSGTYPIYSSSIHNNGEFGRYGLYMFDEELISWSVDGGGNFFYRPKHRFSVTNVCGFMRVNTSKLFYQFIAMQLQLMHSRLFFDYTMKAHPSVIRKAYTLLLPDIKEQVAIATILIDMDTEIEKLESQLTKYQNIKQGMMQTLLTGKIRLLTK